MTAPVDHVYGALDALRSHHPADEMALQAIVERVLLDSSIRHTREVSLGRAGRIDFLTASAIGLECKIKGGSVPLLRQLSRYCAQHERPLSGLVVITTWLLARDVPVELHGVTVRAFVLFGGL